MSEPEGRRRGRPGYDLASVLAVAVELFNERGYDGTSMRDLAARLGIAKSAIYHHVTGKEELLSLALDRPNLVRSTASATSTSPARAGATNTISADAATVTGPKLLQAQANAVSASAKISPPCAMACPFTMSRRTVMRVTARPSPWSISSMPSPREAASFAIIASTLGSRGTVIASHIY